MVQKDSQGGTTAAQYDGAFEQNQKLGLQYVILNVVEVGFILRQYDGEINVVDDLQAYVD